MTHKEYHRKKMISDEEACRAVFEEYCSYVHTVVFNIIRNCGTREDIEECTADIFSDIYRYFDDQTERDGDIKGFIGTVARRKALRYRSKLVSKESISSIDDDENFTDISSDDDIEEEVSASELRKIIIKKIKDLGEPDSTIIIQKYYFNRTSKEISDIVSLSQQAVRVRCFRALKKLKEIFEHSEISF